MIIYWPVLLGDTYEIPIYLPDSLIILGVLVFMGAYVIWKVITYLIGLLPFM